MEVSVFIAMSVDGFIARENKTMDWLHTVGRVLPEEDYGFRCFMDSVDAVIMSRATYETVRSVSAWPYGAKPVVILYASSRDSFRDLEFSRAYVGIAIRDGARLEDRGVRHLYVDDGLSRAFSLTA